MDKLKTPDITAAQIVAVVGAAIACAVAFGAPISHDAREAILQLATVLAPLLIAADAAIRHGRSRSMIVPPKGETPGYTSGARTGPAKVKITPKKRP